MTRSRPPAATHGRGAVLLTALLVVTNFLVVFDGLVVTVALPTVQHDLGLSRAGAQWVLTAYTLPLGGMLLLGGRCGDRYGPRAVLATGLGLFTGGLLVAGAAHAPWLLLTGRVAQGAGAALAVPTSFAVISGRPTAAERDRSFAAVAVAGGLGAAAGAVLGGVVTEGLGWRWVFLLSAPVAACALLAVPALLARRASTAARGGLDVPGAALSVTGLALLVLAVTNVEAAGAVSAPVLVPCAAAAAALLLFVARERRAARPLVRPGVLRVASFRTAVLTMPANEFSYQGSVYLGLLFLQQALGYGPLAAGLAFSPLGLVVLAGSPVARLLLARLRWTAVAAGAQCVSAGGLGLLALASPGDAYAAHVLPALLLLGLGTVVGAVAFNVAAGKDLPTEEKGAGYGVFETAKYVAGALAVAVLGSVAAAGTADAGGRAGAGAGFRLALLVAAGVAVLGGLAVAVLGDRRPSRVAAAPPGEAAGP